MSRASTAESKVHPSWICHECAKYRTDRVHGTIWTWHEDVCDWCGIFKAVTHPRNYNWPEPPKAKKK